jgi:beta-glucosidase
MHDRVASRVRPVRELKAFRKVLLQPGESTEVVFALDRHALAFTNPKGEFGAEPGVFDLWVCASSKSGEAVQFELLTR